MTLLLKCVCFALILLALCVVAVIIEGFTGWNLRFLVGWLSAFTFLAFWPSFQLRRAP